MSSLTKGNKSAYIPSLDGLRAFSILVVFFSHAGLGRYLPGVFGVTVFFFLSGYLITTLLRQEWEGTGSLSFRKFYLRRVLRIFPPLYIALGVASLLCLVGVVQAVLTWPAFFAQALFLANYYEIHADGFGMPPGMAILWSLAVEEHFYMFFPLIYYALRRANLSSAKQVLVLTAICALVLVWRLVLVHVFGVDTADASHGWMRIAHASDTRLDSILWGCVLAVHGNPFLDETRISERAWKYVLLPLGIAALGFAFVYRSEYFRSTYRYSLQGLALVPIFVASIRYPDWWPMRVLNLSWIRRLGVLSYSFYLVHIVVIVVVNRHVPAPTGVRLVLSFVVSLVAADLMWRMIERPSAELRKRLAR